jgi:hypothetical protein
MKHYGVMGAGLLPGIKVGNPEMTGGALLNDGTRTMTRSSRAAALTT